MPRAPRYRRAAALEILAVVLALVNGAFVSGILTGGSALAGGDDERPRMLTSHDAVLQGAPLGGTKVIPPTQGCRALLDAAHADCAVAHTAAGDLVVTTEPGPRVDDVLVSRPWTVRVYRPSPTVPDGWELALESRATDGYAGALFARVTAEVVDVTGDGADELVVGYRAEGTGHVLDYDIVATRDDGAPLVLAHDELYRGTVVVEPGRLVTYSPVYRETDGNCCPSWIRRDTVRYERGAFHVRRGPRVPTARADVPAGDLG